VPLPRSCMRRTTSTRSSQGKCARGNTFTVTKLDRLARSVGDLLAIVSRLEAKGVSLRVLSMSGTQSLDTSTATDRLMLSVIGALGQAEREAMLERQREGIAKAKAQGRYKGRVPTVRRQAAGNHQAQRVGHQAVGNRQQARYRPGQCLPGAGHANRQ
jgi:DNA invertase Pin-like site-specific DNA recombinase